MLPDLITVFEAAFVIEDEGLNFFLISSLFLSFFNKKAEKAKEEI